MSDYYQRVVDAVSDPAGFPTGRRTAYVPESELLLVEWDLPKVAVVPELGSFRYVKARDEIDSRAVPLAERRATYQRLIAQLALRALRLAFGADPRELVGTVVVNGMIDDIDPATGQDVRRCLITLRATRDQFTPLRLERVKPVNCIREHFHADVSEHPDELTAVQPVLEFDMADPRVVDPIDVLSEIDRRPNLLDLTPTEFEHFIQNLFAKMGLQVQVFRAGGDGGRLRRVRPSADLRRQVLRSGQALPDDCAAVRRPRPLRRRPTRGRHEGTAHHDQRLQPDHLQLGQGQAAAAHRRNRSAVDLQRARDPGADPARAWWKVSSDVQVRPPLRSFRLLTETGWRRSRSTGAAPAGVPAWATSRRGQAARRAGGAAGGGSAPDGSGGGGSGGAVQPDDTHVDVLQPAAVELAA